MPTKFSLEALHRTGDIVALRPQIVGRFYRDANRLGQRPPQARKPRYWSPERWIGSSTKAANPPNIPSGGLSTCRDFGGAALKDLLAHPEAGPRLLGDKRFARHSGAFRVLIKLLDAGCPIPFHVHANDAYVSRHPSVYPNDHFGKDEAYHFLEAPKGECPYTHVGLFPGVTMKETIAAFRQSDDHVLELSPGALQVYGEGFMVRAGLLHRPGTALTLEIQQPSDVYAFFQTKFGEAPIPASVMHPGFKQFDHMAAAVVDWKLNLTRDLLEKVRLRPTPVSRHHPRGAKVEWVFPPSASRKFSGMRLTVDTALTLRAQDPCILFVWRGRGTLDGQQIAGGNGPVGRADEFFVGAQATRRGVEFRNTGDEPLVAFALFAEAL